MMEESGTSRETITESGPGVAENETSASFWTYTAGLGFALLLTAASFIVAQTDLLWAPGVAAGLAVLAVAQMGVHLVFFLHIGTDSEGANNVLALAFGVFIVALVVVGSLWIMDHMNENMMSPSQMMDMQR
jgi:cytochrome o ubiquinol oxidase operon protein cyoD